MFIMLLRRFVMLPLLLAAVPAASHPVPFSYLDLHLAGESAEGTLTIHAVDAAHELGVAEPQTLLQGGMAPALRLRLERLMGQRLDLAGEAIEWTGLSRAPDDEDALRLSFRLARGPGAAAKIHAALFPYDPNHQTFINIYEDGELRRQAILSARSDPITYYRGTSAGVGAVIGTFVPAGVHHILIGPDHLLFLFGLMLMGGSWRKLVGIVTAFTIGHSITLSLAALSILTPPAAIVEPLIALSIVVVGADALLQRRAKEGRDLRAWFAGGFGLIHGFGFASVLREFGLPQEALGWSLFSFNVGVELGQLAVVLVVATILAMIARASPLWRSRVTLAGSLVVITAGLYWFAERTMFAGVA
jgi:hydrogenase/urease accessory protein HupE